MTKKKIIETIGRMWNTGENPVQIPNIYFTLFDVLFWMCVSYIQYNTIINHQIIITSGQNANNFSTLDSEIAGSG